MKTLLRGWLFPVLVLLAGCATQTATVAPAATPPGGRPRNLVLVTIDGLRWQEVFRGAEDALLTREAGGVPANQMEALRRDFWAGTPEERRQKLMPFLWSTVVARGSVVGNRDAGSKVSVLNPHWVSYPGYNELLTGQSSDFIVSNAPVPNPHTTVLEWLQQKPAFAGRVQVCAEWRVFTSIINAARSRVPVWTTRQHSPPESASPRVLEIEKWMDDIPFMAPDEHFDAFVNETMKDTVARRRPRVLLLAFGEPDSHAHGRRYDRYLYSIQRCDRFIRELYEWLQTQPEYRDNTAILITPDHGRGVQGEDWTGHGKNVPRSNETWFAACGPDTPARGEWRAGTPELHQAQIAATVAALLGEDFRAAFPNAAAPIAEVLRVAAR